MTAPLPAYDYAVPARVSGASAVGATSQGAGGASAALAALAAISGTATTTHVARFVDAFADVLRCRLTVHERETLESALAAAVLSIVAGQIAPLTV